MVGCLCWIKKSENECNLYIYFFLLLFKKSDVTDIQTLSSQMVIQIKNVQNEIHASELILSIAVYDRSPALQYITKNFLHFWSEISYSDPVSV